MYADKGAVGLAGFLNGMDASREHGAGDAHMTVFGHSYGSTTSGKAAALVNEGVVADTMPGFHHLSGDVGPAPKAYDPVGLHMAYFDEGTQAQREIAGVIAGVGRS